MTEEERKFVDKGPYRRCGCGCGADADADADAGSESE